jgi:hypothetical protein
MGQRNRAWGVAGNLLASDMAAAARSCWAGSRSSIPAPFLLASGKALHAQLPARRACTQGRGKPELAHLRRDALRTLDLVLPLHDLGRRAATIARAATGLAA